MTIEKPDPDAGTTCNGCKRAAYVKDLDKDGMCVECVGKKAPPGDEVK